MTLGIEATELGFVLCKGFWEGLLGLAIVEFAEIERSESSIVIMSLNKRKRRQLYSLSSPCYSDYVSLVKEMGSVDIHRLVPGIENFSMRPGPATILK